MDIKDPKLAELIKNSAPSAEPTYPEFTFSDAPDFAFTNEFKQPDFQEWKFDYDALSLDLCLPLFMLCLLMPSFLMQQLEITLS